VKQQAFHEVRLDTLGGGAAVELFEKELRKVIENIYDPNTEPDAKRTITLKATFKPHDEGRDTVAVLLEAKSSVAPHKPHGTVVYVGREAKGAPLVAVERDQRDMFETEEERDDDVVPLDRKEGQK